VVSRGRGRGGKLHGLDVFPANLEIVGLMNRLTVLPREATRFDVPVRTVAGSSGSDMGGVPPNDASSSVDVDQDAPSPGWTSNPGSVTFLVAE
jgi:hypothetical protein